MSLRLNAEALRLGVEEASRAVAERGEHVDTLEPLGCARRWAGEEQAARAAFAAAALAAQEHPGVRRGRTSQLGQVGGLLLLAGDVADGRRWIDLALAAVGNEVSDAQQMEVPLRWLLGEPDAALAAANRFEEPWPIVCDVVDLVVAARDGEAGNARAAQARIAGRLRRDGSPPWTATGSTDMTDWGWLMEAASVEARVLGSEAPSPEAILRANGLWDDELDPHAVEEGEGPDLNPYEGRWEVDGGTMTVPADLPVLVEAAGERITVDMRQGAWVAQLPDGTSLGPMDGFRAACDAAAERAAAPDVVRALARAPFVRDDA